MAPHPEKPTPSESQQQAVVPSAAPQKEPTGQEVAPEAAVALTAVDEDRTARTEMGEDTRPLQSIIKQDDGASEKLKSSLSEMKRALIGKLRAVQSTSTSEAYPFMSGLLAGKIVDAIDQVNKTSTEVLANIDQAKALRDDKKFEEARALLTQTQTKTKKDLEAAIAMDIEKEAKANHLTLTDETKSAWAEFKTTAEHWFGQLDALFETRGQALGYVENPSSAPVAIVSPPTEPAAPSEPTAPIEAQVSPEHTVTLETIGIRSMTEQLDHLKSFLGGIDLDTNWFWLDGSHAKQKAAISAAQARVEALRTELDQGSADIESLISGKDYAGADQRYATLKAKTNRGLEAAFNEFSSIPDNEWAGKLQATQEIQRVAGAMSTDFDRIHAALMASKTSVDQQTAAATVAATTATSAAAAEDAAVDEETAPEDPREKTRARVKELYSELSKAYLEKPPNFGSIISAGFEMIGILFTTLNGDNIMADLGFYFGGLFDKETLPAGVFANPVKILEAVGLAARELRWFKTLSMRDLYSFYEYHKNPTGKEKPEIERFDQLQAFATDHADVYNSVTQQIFETHDGDAYAKDPDTKGKSVLDFLGTKLSETWKTQQSED